MIAVSFFMPYYVGRLVNQSYGAGVDSRVDEGHRPLQGGFLICANLSVDRVIDRYKASPERWRWHGIAVSEG